MEPSLHQIEDYNNQESKEKRTIVNLVIVGLLVVGFVYGGIKSYYANQSLDIYTPTIHQR